MVGRAVGPPCVGGRVAHACGTGHRSGSLGGARPCFAVHRLDAPFFRTLACSGEGLQAHTCLFLHRSPGTRRPWGPTQSTDRLPRPLPGVFSFLGYLGWKKSPPPLLFSLIPQMKFQHMSPNIIPLRLWITFPQTMSSTGDSSSPKCLPKRLGPLLEALSLPWANREYL